MVLNVNVLRLFAEEVSPNPNSRSHTPVLYVQAQPMALSPPTLDSSAPAVAAAAAAAECAPQQTTIAPPERGTSQASLSGSRSGGHFQTKAQPNAYVKRDSTSAGSGSASAGEPSDRRRSTTSHGHTIQYATIDLPEPVSSIPANQTAATADADADADAVAVTVTVPEPLPRASTSSLDAKRRESVGDESGYMPPEFAEFLNEKQQQQQQASANELQTIASREPSHRSHTENSPLIDKSPDTPVKCLVNNRALGVEPERRLEAPRAATLARAPAERVPLLEADQLPSRSNSDSHSRSGTSTFSNSSRLTNSGNSQSVFNGENAADAAATRSRSQQALFAHNSTSARASAAVGAFASHAPTGVGAVALKEDTQREYLEMEPTPQLNRTPQSRGATAPNNQQIERQRSATSLSGGGAVAPIPTAAATDQPPSLKPQSTWGPWHQANPPNNLSQ